MKPPFSYYVLQRVATRKYLGRNDEEVELIQDATTYPDVSSAHYRAQLKLSLWDELWLVLKVTPYTEVADLQE